LQRNYGLIYFENPFSSPLGKSNSGYFGPENTESPSLILKTLLECRPRQVIFSGFSRHPMRDDATETSEKLRNCEEFLVVISDFSE
jgi:hypothetical protein